MQAFDSYLVTPRPRYLNRRPGNGPDICAFTMLAHSLHLSHNGPTALRGTDRLYPSLLLRTCFYP